MTRASFLVLATIAIAGCRGRAPSPSASAPAPKPVADADVRPAARSLGGGVALADFGGRRRAIVADEEARAVQVVDVGERRVTHTLPLDAQPGQILLAPDGTLFVALRSAARVVALRFRADGTTREVARHVTATEPWGLALTPDAKTLAVTTIADPGLETFAAADLAPGVATPLPRDPRAVAITADGARALVTHATGSMMSVVALADGTSRSIGLDVLERRRDFGMELVTKPAPMSPGDDLSFMKGAHERPTAAFTMRRVANQGFGVAVVGAEVLLPETLVMTGPKDAIPAGYGSIEQSTLETHVPYLARVSIEGQRLLNDRMSGPVDRACFERKVECIVPRAVAEDGRKLYVACADSDEVLVVDPAADAERAPTCKKTFEQRRRIAVESPTAVAAAHGAVVAFSAFTRKVTIAPADGDAFAIALPPSDAVDASIAEGQRLFHGSGNARIAKNGRACASCHVDGRDDGLVWPTPRGKRQTPTLAGRIDGTAPYGWNGEHPTLAAHITRTVKNLEGTGLDDRELDALARYVAKMHAATKPAHDDAIVARGRTIFFSDEAGCASCHIEATKLTDGETHALVKKREAFATPSLAFVGETAPYFHDDRFATLDALVDACDEPDTKMGHTAHLDVADRRALAAFLRTL